MTAALPLLLHAHCPPSWHLTDEQAAPFRRQRFELVFEALLPLLELFDGLAAEGVDASVTLALSPALLAQLTAETAPAELDADIEAAVRLAGAERDRLRDTPLFSEVAEWHALRAVHRATYYRQHCRPHVLAPLLEHARQGRIGLLSSPPAQALLPAIAQPELAWLHVRAALAAFGADLSAAPRGLWLPGCAGLTGLSAALEGAGCDFAVASHAGAVSHRIAGPLQAGSYNGEPACFVADSRLADRLLAQRTDPQYLGRPLSMTPGGPTEHAAPIATAADWSLGRLPLFHAAPAPGQPPTPYAPDAARAHAVAAAQRWLADLAGGLQALDAGFGQALPVMALDLRLLGPWWSEGPTFLEALARSAPDVGLRLTGAGQLDGPTANPAGADEAANPPVRPWVSRTNANTFRELEVAQARILPLLARADRLQRWERRALAQAVRELLFAQSADWPALVHAAIHVDAARTQLAGHLSAVHDLVDRIEARSVDRDALRRQEALVPVWRHSDALLGAAAPEG